VWLVGPNGTYRRENVDQPVTIWPQGEEYKNFWSIID
jgi:hypothetical protein